MRAARWGAVVAVTAAVAVAPAAPGHADEVRDAQWHLDALAVAEAHQHSLGEGVTVAVLDSGVDAGHPDLRGAVLPGVDLTGRGPDGRDDPAGTGTALAGLIAGRGHLAADEPAAGADEPPAEPSADPGEPPDGSSAAGPASGPEQASDPDSGTDPASGADPDLGAENAAAGDPATGDPDAGPPPDGVLGLAPAATVLPVVVAEPGLPPEPDTLVAGLAEAVRRGADVICLGRPVPDDPAVTQALGAAVTAGAVVVVPGRPAGDALARYGGSGLLGAVAADASGPVDSPSAATFPPGSVVVPAAGTMSTGGQGGYYQYGRGGDAAASAVLAGAAALVRAAYPELPAHEVAYRITQTSPGGTLDLVAALTAPPATPTPTGPPASPAPETATGADPAGEYVAAFDSEDWRRWLVASPLVVFLVLLLVGSVVATRRARR